MINKKSEGTLIEAVMELIACSPGLLKKMKPTAQDSQLRRTVRLYIREFGGNLAKGKKFAKFASTSWKDVFAYKCYFLARPVLVNLMPINLCASLLRQGHNTKERKLRQGDNTRLKC